VHTTSVVEGPADLTVEWLSSVLGSEVAEFSHERIGTGQMSDCYRLTLRYTDGSTGPASVVLKVAATDPASRQTGLALGLYEREVRFYTDVAPRISGPVAPCHSAAFDGESGAFHLLLGDAAPAVVGDEIRGTTVENAMLALAELGRVHGPPTGSTGRRRSTRPCSASCTRVSSSATATRSPPSTAWCANACSRCSTSTWPPRPPTTGSRVWCTATTGWTTCFSARRVPTVR
jgi:hypothetical protein